MLVAFCSFFVEWELVDLMTSWRFVEEFLSLEIEQEVL